MWNDNTELSEPEARATPEPEAESLGSGDKNKQLEPRLLVAGSAQATPEPEAESLGSGDPKVFYHYVFKTYKSRSILIDKDVVSFLYKTFYQIAKLKGFKIISCNILADHIHCLVEFKKSHRVDYIMRIIKGTASRLFFEKYDTNRYVYRKLWGRSYYAEKIDPDKLNMLCKYINNQKINGIDKRYILSRNRDF
jgi:REP element-mobilizing transposase RayT